MNVNGVGSGVESDQVLFQFANTTDGALKSLFNKDSLLRMHHLIVALFQFSIDVDVFDIKTC